MERTEIAYGWEKKNCNVCLTVFLCLNEANENKGEAACRILNSHCESCYSMYTNRIFLVDICIHGFNNKSDKTSTISNTMRRKNSLDDSNVLLNFWYCLRLLNDNINFDGHAQQVSGGKKHFFYPIECIMLNIIEIFYQNMGKKQWSHKVGM